MTPKREKINTYSKISIVVPCYNVANFVDKCIQSIKNQTYPNFKVLLIDDGSTDNTLNIIKKSISKDSRFKLYHKSNGGLSSARNFGLKKVDTELVCFIDSDDYIEPNYLELLLNNMRQEKSDVSACYVKAVHPNFDNIIAFKNDFSGLARTPAAWNKLYKTELFHLYNLSYPEGKCYEDVEVSSELLLVNVKFSIVPVPLYNYIQNPKSISHTYDNTIYDIYSVLYNIEKFAKKNNLIKSCHNKIEFINIYQCLISTTTRAAHRSDFSTKTLSDILKRLENRYPEWYNNPYMSTLPPFYQKYLGLLYNHKFKMSFLLLKIFNNSSRLKNIISKFGKHH